MKERLLDILVCPIDKKELDLIVWEEKENKFSEEDLSKANKLGIDIKKISKEIISGVLLNKTRKIYYPIYNGIPRLLPYRNKLTDAFEKQFSFNLKRDIPEYKIPNEKPATGEGDVLKSFSSEWVEYDWDGESYWNLSAEDMFKCMHFMLNLDSKPLTSKLVLEAGIGIGGIADYVCRSQKCELVGIDLGYAVDSAYKHFSTNKFFHVVQASIFSLPFKEKTFDFVYSQGVIHHTFSTETAFNRLAELPKEKGRLYVWVYSPHDESRTFKRRLIMSLENLLRPIIWRLPGKIQTLFLLPIIPFYILHQNMMCRHNPQQKQIKYGFREALHAARDRFTPRYIYRHSNEEVSKWFEINGFKNIECINDRKAPLYIPEAFTACTGVEGIREN